VALTSKMAVLADRCQRKTVLTLHNSYDAVSASIYVKVFGMTTCPARTAIFDVSATAEVSQSCAVNEQVFFKSEFARATAEGDAKSGDEQHVGVRIIIGVSWAAKTIVERAEI